METPDKDLSSLPPDSITGEFHVVQRKPIVSRRRVLQLLGAGSAVGFSGCGQEHQKDATTQINTTAHYQTETTTATETEETTREEPKNLEVDPLEHDKFVGAYYYPWYRKSYWNTYPIPGTPTLRHYDSRNPDVINQHIKWSIEHGINAWLVDWIEAGVRETWIEDHFLDADLSEEISFLMAPAKDPGGEPYIWDGDKLNFDRPQNRQQLRQEYDRFDRLYFSQPNYKTIDGRPVVFEYLAGRVFTGDIKGAFREVKESISSDVYLVADVLDTPWVANLIHKDWMEVFDAVTDYSLYSREVARSGDYQDFLEYAERTFTERNLLADSADFDYIPNLIPGYHDSRGSPVLERSPEGFRQLSEIIMNRLDPELDGLFITSFNEWPEYTSVEPAEEYGETYLKIITDKIAKGQSGHLDKDQFDLLEFEFNKTVKPTKVNPSSTDSRDLAFMISRIVVGDGSVSYNIGVPENEPYFVEGAYAPGGNETADDPAESNRWLGGPTGRSAIYLEKIDSEQITIYGRPMVDNEIECDVYYNNEYITHLSLGIRGGEPNEYVISLSPN